MPTDMRQFFFLLTAIILALVSWLLYIEIANSVYWRTWHLSNPNISAIWIGLWKFCYLQYNPHRNHETVVCAGFNSSWVYPIEFYYFQDLIILPIFLQVTGIIFSVGAFLIVLKNEPYPYFINTCLLIAGCCFTSSGIIVGISVICNAYMDLRGLSTLKLPEKFLFKMTKIIEREIGLSLPLGILSAVSSFISGILLFCQICCSKISRVYPQDKIPDIRKGR